MSCGLAIQTKQYGAITTFDVLYNGRLIASLIKEDTNFVDYVRRRVFQKFDAAIEFYLAQVAPDKHLGLLTIGYLTEETAFVIHDSCLSFPL